MNRVADELATVGTAVQFLTRLPVPAGVYTAERLAASVRWYPLVGALVGAIGAGVYWLAAQALPPVVAALLSTAATLLSTGAFHEDGLADLCDGMGAGTRERMLEVMRDSRLGTFGAAGLGIALAAKVTTLAGMPLGTAMAALVGAHAASRASAVLAIATSRYARDTGTAKPVASGVNLSGGAVVLLCAAGALLPILALHGGGALLAALAGLATGHLATRLLYERRLGGYTGDCLGAVQQLSEIGLYIGLLAWL